MSDTDVVRLSYTKITDESRPTSLDDTTSSPKERPIYTVFEQCSGPFNRIDKICNHYAWSPIVFKPHYRRKANFLFSELVALDFDDGKFTLKDAEEFIQDNSLSAYVGVTKSHQKMKNLTPPCDRFRMVIRAQTACPDVDAYEYTVKQLIQETGADASCSDAARFFYSCTHTIYLTNGSNLIEWLEPPYEQSSRYKAEIAKRINKFEYRDLTKLPESIWGDIMFGCRPPGRHKMCYVVGAQLAIRGFLPDEIFDLLVKNNSPLLAIGEADARRAIRNGAERAMSDIGQPYDNRTVGERLKDYKNAAKEKAKEAEYARIRQGVADRRTIEQTRERLRIAREAFGSGE